MTTGTLAEKIIARAAGHARVSPGEIVTCRVDLAMMHDSGGPRRVQPILERLGARVWNPAQVVVVTDHYVPAFDADSRGILELTRRWAAAQGVDSFYDQQGICHVVLPERGHLRPGMFVVGGDSHSPTGGAFGCYMFGIGATEMAGVLVTGDIWLKVPETILIRWNGKLSPGVVAKDIMLFLCTRLGMDGGAYQAVQYGGPAVTALPMQERMTLCNMTAELGGQTGLIEPDTVTADFLRAAGADPGELEPWQDQPDAVHAVVHEFDAAELPPQVAAPHSPAHAETVESFTGTGIDVAYIGSCTGAKLADLRMAASVLKRRRVASGVRLLVAPASLRDAKTAQTEGTLAALVDAGATLLPSACGMCAGYGEQRLGENLTCISSTARNFRGRMGAPSSRVFLGSPYTVAAAAITGHIVDPREFLNEEARP